MFKWLKVLILLEVRYVKYLSRRQLMENSEER